MYWSSLINKHDNVTVKSADHRCPFVESSLSKLGTALNVKVATSCVSRNKYIGTRLSWNNSEARLFTLKKDTKIKYREIFLIEIRKLSR